MKDKLCEKIRKEFLGLRRKTYNYLIGDGSEAKKSKSYQKVSHKNNLKFED